MDFKKLVSFSTLLICSFCLLGQNSKKIDSLFEAYNNKNANDTDRIKAFIFLSHQLSHENPDTIIHYAKDAIALSKEKISKPMEANLYKAIADCYDYNEDYQNSIANYTRAAEIWESLDNNINAAVINSNIGNAYAGISNYPKALEFLLKAQKVLEVSKNKLEIGKVYLRLGLLYFYQDNNKLALDQFLKSLRIFESINYESGIRYCIGNLGIVYQALKDYEKSMYYYNKGNQLSELAGDKVGISTGFTNIASVYADMKDYKNAMDYQKKALAIFIELGFKSYISTVYTNIASLNNITGNYSEAIKNYELAKLNSKESIDDLRLSHQGLAITYEKLGNYKAAYENHVQFKKLTDSIFNTENNQQMSALKTKYEVEKNAAEFEVKAQAQKAKQQLILYSILALLGIVSIFAIILFKRYQFINKQKDIIEQKIKETEEQKKIVEQKQKEIIDSITYAKRLQNAILPPLDAIEKSLSNSFVYYQPKDIVAGDFYWMETVNDCVFIAAADSTGHGVPGAMVSVVCSNALNRAVKEFHLTDTGEILNKTRQLVLETFEKNSSQVSDGMDISLLSINKTKKEIQWSGAYNPLWYILDGEMIQIKADKQPIGKSENPTAFTTQTIQYIDNMTFYLFTDGFADQFGGPEGKKIKQKAFSDLLIKHHKRNSADQLEIIQSTFSDWKGELEQVDDVCVIGIRI
jgi:serine phosphatase RsbU (regulator of sigma subunit)